MGNFKGLRSKVNALTIRKQEEIFTTAPGECLDFSFIPSIQPTKRARTGKQEKIRLRTGEAHIPHFNQVFMVLYTFMLEFLIKFFPDERFC